MSVPVRRNQKKHRKTRSPYFNRSQRSILETVDTGQPGIEEKPSFEDWLDEIVYPGDWLGQYPFEDSLGERLLGDVALRRLDTREDTESEPDEDDIDFYPGGDDPDGIC